MRLTLQITLTLIVTLAVAPALWAQDDSAAVAEVGYVPDNLATESTNVSTDTRGETFAALSSRTTEQVLDRLVNITFVNADLENALRIIARQMDLNIIIGPGVRGRTITLDLRDVPLRFALDSILSANDLGFIIERGGIVRVVPISLIRPDAIERQTTVRKLNWLSSEQVEAILNDFMSDEGTLRSDTQSNSIIVSDVPSRIEEIDRLMDEIDVPERQVSIEARMVDIAEDAVRRLRSEFEISRDDSENFSNSGRDGVAVIPPSIDPVAGVFNLGDRFVGEFDLAVELEAFEQEGLARTLAAPRVTTVNNVPALIEIKREIPFTEAVQGPSDDTITNEVEFKDEGLELRVVPTITNNGYVRMEIQAEQLILTGFSQGIPIIDRRTSLTNTIVEDGNTVALGGLRQLEALNDQSGIPWFRKLPVMGFLFRSDNFDRNRLDFYLFVTPEILHDPNVAAAERYAHDLIDLEWAEPRDYFGDDMEIEVTY
jgi:type IV pilus assembly protein PilQ